MEKLPPDVFGAVCAGLTGFDLFRLSHVNAQLLRLITTEQRWRRFFLRNCSDDCQEASDQVAKRLKRQYMLARSLEFTGRSVVIESYERFGGRFIVGPVGKFASVYHVNADGLYSVTPRLIQNFGPGRNTTITIDTWFSLLPEDAQVHTGGILLGIQSTRADSRLWPHYHQQRFIMVDANRNLYCSLLDREDYVDDRVATDLTPQRWYHLALTYDGDARVQQVFLDGNLVDSRASGWHRDWENLHFAQVGTGCITADDNRTPVAGRSCWYSFHGIVDEFRVWKRVLTGEEIKSIACNTVLPNESDLWYSMSQCGSGTAYPLTAPQIQCTRPSEGWCIRLLERKTYSHKKTESNSTMLKYQKWLVALVTFFVLWWTLRQYVATSEDDTLVLQGVNMLLALITFGAKSLVTLVAFFVLWWILREYVETYLGNTRVLQVVAVLLPIFALATFDAFWLLALVIYLVLWWFLRQYVATSLGNAHLLQIVNVLPMLALVTFGAKSLVTLVTFFILWWFLQRYVDTYMHNARLLQVVNILPILALVTFGSYSLVALVVFFVLWWVLRQYVVVIFRGDARLLQVVNVLLPMLALITFGACSLAVIC